MGGSDLADGAADEVLTVLAALVHAGRPRTIDALGLALAWPRDRVVGALDLLERHPNPGDPLALLATGAKTFTVTTRPDRLSQTQREALAR